MSEKVKYSDEELKEFETLIKSKLEVSRKELESLRGSLSKKNDNSTESTTGVGHSLESGTETAERESLNQLAARQSKYVKNLEDALVRIKNGTYGICSVTGKLIQRERLLAVPHTTQSMEAKLQQ